MAKVKTSELEKLYNRYNGSEILSLSVNCGEGKFDFEVKHRLDADEMAKVVKEVCSGVVDNMTGTYRPEMKDYLLRKAVLKAYTNLTLPKGEKCWNLVYGTPVFAMVAGHERRPVFFNGREYDENMVIDVEQYEQIISAIDRRIAYIITQNIGKECNKNLINCIRSME